MGLTIAFQGKWRIAEPVLSFLHKQLSFFRDEWKQMFTFFYLSSLFFSRPLTKELTLHIVKGINSIRIELISLGPTGQARADLMFYLNVFYKRSVRSTRGMGRITEFEVVK